MFKIKNRKIFHYSLVIGSTLVVAPIVAVIIYFSLNHSEQITSQPTKYIDENGVEQTTDDKDLSNMPIKKITQIGFYDAGPGIIRAVRMPKIVEEVPNELPSQITSLNSMFLNCQVFNGDISNWNTSNVTSMFYLFDNALAFNQDISNWNTANVRSMNNMFYGASAFNQDISRWDTSNVTNMSYMFNNAKAFNCNISNWNTSNVTNMNYMFNNAKAFNQDLSGWNVDKVTKFEYFAVDSGFADDIAKQPRFLGKQATIYLDENGDEKETYEQDLSNMPIKKITQIGFYSTDGFIFAVRMPKIVEEVPNELPSQITSLNSMFLNCQVFNGDISNWDTSNVTNMRWMFSDAYAFNQDISNWNTSNVTNMTYMFNHAKAFNQDISNWNTANVTSMYGMFYNASAFNQDLSGWNVEKVINYTNFAKGSGFDENYEKQPQFLGRQATIYLDENGDEKSTYAQDLSNMPIKKITQIGFYEQNGIIRAVRMPKTIEEVPNELPSQITSLDSMFRDCKIFNGDISNWDTSNVTNMRWMFYDAYAFNQDISNWNTSNVTNMDYMFFNAYAFNQDLSRWDTANVTNMKSMFYGAEAFNQDLSRWDTANVTNMKSMFYGAKAFNQDLSGWNVEKVINYTNFAKDSGFADDNSKWPEKFRN